MNKLASIFFAALMSTSALASEEDIEFGPKSVKAPNEGYARIGVLTCNIEAGIGLIITSNKHLDCTYVRKADDVEITETYEGSIRKFGLDLGVTGDGVLKWVIFAPTTRDVDEMGLSGTYTGASAEASAIIGLGANALVGGSNKAIVLQPFSVQVQTGINFALGVTSMSIEKTGEL